MARKRSSETVNPLFGQLFRGLRNNAVPPLSQNKAAELLEVSGPFISRMERGERNPPQNQDFYERINQLPGVRPEDIATLLAVVNISEYRKNIKTDLQTPSLTFPFISAPGTLIVGDCRVTYTLETVPGRYNHEDLLDINEIVRRTLALTLRNHFRSRTPR